MEDSFVSDHLCSDKHRVGYEESQSECGAEKLPIDLIQARRQLYSPGELRRSLERQHPAPVSARLRVLVYLR
jgi:hypothetical protein